MNRPHTKSGKFGITFQTFQISTFRNFEIDKHLEVLVCPFPNFGNMLLMVQPLWWFTVLSLVTAKGNKDDRSVQAVQDEASLSPAATRAEFSTAPRP